jgi:uncharacterized membrane protein
MWLAYSVLSAFFDAFWQLGNKKLASGMDRTVVNLALFLCALPVYLITLASEGVPEIGIDYLWSAPVNILIDFIAFNALTMAYAIGEMSMVMPLLSFSSIIVVLTGPLIVGESPSMIGIVGIFVLVAGAYLLNLSTMRDGWLRPLRALFTQRASQLALFVAVLWGLNSQVAKVSLENASAGFHLTVVSLAGSLAFGLQLWMKRRRYRVTFNPRKAHLLLMMGVFAGISVIAQFAAYSAPGGLVAYVISIKRLSLLLGTFFGWLFFRERNIRERAAGAALMLTGVALMAIYG